LILTTPIKLQVFLDLKCQYTSKKKKLTVDLQKHRKVGISRHSAQSKLDVVTLCQPSYIQCNPNNLTTHSTAFKYFCEQGFLYVDFNTLAFLKVSGMITLILE